MPPNFVRLDAALPDVARLVTAMVQARDAAERLGLPREPRMQVSVLPLELLQMRCHRLHRGALREVDQVGAVIRHVFVRQIRHGNLTYRTDRAEPASKARQPGRLGDS
jgi:hypothetical protein